MTSTMLRPIPRLLRVSQCAAAVQRLSTVFTHRCTSSSSSANNNNNNNNSNNTSSSASAPAPTKSDAPTSRFRQANQYRRAYHTDATTPAAPSSATAVNTASDTQPLSFTQLQHIIAALSSSNNYHHNHKQTSPHSSSPSTHSSSDSAIYPADQWYPLPYPILQQFKPAVLYSLCENKPLPRGVLSEGEERELEVYNDRLPAIAPPTDRVDEPLLMNTKRTYQPKVLQRKRKHGFLSRLRHKKGKQTLLRRLQKGRWRLSA